MIGNYFIIKEMHLCTLENQGGTLFFIFILLLLLLVFKYNFLPLKMSLFLIKMSIYSIIKIICSPCPLR